MTSQSQPEGVRTVRYRNDAGETIPAYALIQFTGSATVDGQILWTAEQWDGGDTEDVFYFNGPVDVPDGTIGLAIQPNTAQWVLYDDADTPAFQEEWGPVADSYEIGADGTGFIIMSAGTSGRVLAVAKGGSGGSGGGGFVVLFEICEACCVECWADVTILSKSSSESMPLTGQLLTECAECGEDDAYEKQLLDNQIRVYDVMGCMLDEPNEDLIGRRGYARYMFNDAKDCDGATITLTCNRCGVEVPFPSPRWEVFELCPYEDPCV